MKEWVIQSISPKISIYIANISSKWEENIALFNILLKMQFHSIQFYQKIFYTNVYIFRFAQQISIKLWLLRDDTLWVWRLFFITQDHIYVTQNMWWALSLLKSCPLGANLWTFSSLSYSMNWLLLSTGPLYACLYQNNEFDKYLRFTLV